MKQVEKKFAELQRIVINKGEFPSVKDLEKKD